MHIEVDDLSRPAIHALLEEHLQSMRALSPPESVHALDLEKLRQPGITFWSAWDGSLLLGCGALKELDAGHAEVKSMRTPAALRRRGAGRAILAHMIGVARARSYSRLSLETGSMEAFRPAQALYESFGFTYCGPFGQYRDDPNSVFMTMTLGGSTMAEPADEAEAARWHRRFAVACNNRAWELAVQQRSAAEDRELLDAAHTSAWHWGKIGTELNRMRATLLLAEVHALLGMGPSALAFAETVRDYTLGRETEAWELALVHAVHAHAAHAAGHSAMHRESWARASSAVAAIASEEERKIVLATFNQVPRP